MRKDILASIQTRNQYTDRQIILLNHGIDIVISDGINMTVLLMISAAAGDLLQGIVWLLTFTGMRKYSGGWHASTRFRCFLSYQAVFVLMLMCSGFITDLRIIVCTFLDSVSYTIRNAPVQHIFNPLSEQEKAYTESYRGFHCVCRLLFE